MSSSKQSEPSLIKKVSVTSNSDKTKKGELSSGTVRLMYFESIMQDTIKASVTFVDSGYRTGGNTEGTSYVQGLPITGEESVSIEFEDNNKQSIKVIMYVEQAPSIAEDTNKSSYNLHLTTAESFFNEKIRLNMRYDGNITDNFKKIFTENLKTDANLDFEETSGEFNFIGNKKKPFYTLNWLSKKAQPNTDTKTPGFLFWQTSEGFKFRSIESLMKQKAKKTFIYNETPDNKGTNIPEGYDGKILAYNQESDSDAIQKLKMGAKQTRIVLFDPWNCQYQVINNDKTDANTETSGKKLPVGNEKFNVPNSGGTKDTISSRTTYYLLDTGTLPSGSGLGKGQQQLTKSKNQNFEYAKIENQSIMQYNSLFASKATITIAGDFSLHAGDTLFIDVPSPTSGKTDKVNPENGGLYIIADLCHYLSTEGTYTKLNLVRNSIGRKGNPTSSKTSTEN